VKLVSSLKSMLFFEFIPQAIILVIMVAAADVVVLLIRRANKANACLKRLFW
jgi:hypothetical protein